MKNRLLFIVTTVTLLISSYANFAQAPNLGTAKKFVIFSTVGAIGNTGTAYVSHITGNVGTNSGAITGFGNVNGVMHNNDSETASATAGLLSAYNYLDTLTSTRVLAPVLGNGDTLKAGVFAVSGNTSLTGKLILNGQGNANAVFIFQIEGSLSSADSARIVLINGALACNVFWKIEGLVSLASATVIRGTLIANNAAINMAPGVTLEGRALSIAGAVSSNRILAYIPTGCGSERLTGPVAPVLKISGCFAIFSGNGSVTNSGITHVTGDVGTDAGLTGGYDPLYVTGYIHPVPDGYTAACKADLLNVYAYLNTLPVNIELLYPAQFGRSLVLTPHTYIMNGAAMLTDSLFLNAEGNFNAVFVIKIKGALSTSTFSKVLLVNGAQAKNVFWSIDGAVDISDSSLFNGTIVCNNGAINLNTGTTLNGRALTTDGALNTSKIIITSPSGNCNLLPVSWLYFRGKPVLSTVQLEWGTTNEINNGFFTIEKSIDGTAFKTLTNIQAAGENGKADYHYSFTDLLPYSTGYYLISQTDKDGQKTYYRTIKVKAPIGSNLRVQNFVSGNYIYTKASGAVPGNGSIDMYNISGKRMSSQKITLTKEISIYKINKPLQNGVYLLNIISKERKLYWGKIMVF